MTVPLPGALTAAETELDVSLRADPLPAPSPTHVGQVMSHRGLDPPPAVFPVSLS